ncbi:Acg family FMN-binding oxidoreductase [Nocardia blacklockiae]|uniref:Acg family FMN-binding oxidoreductase n=1 Tax=Nocardia blacklockiae TaxID=480036 RepID=UPI00189498A7|nr:hypothetical protein [Nocardia blacklockiae]MBF6170657.1 hypothetical protein [Nocardia blacklockiae]
MTDGEPLTVTQLPDHRTVAAVLEVAGRAPSVHNTQPWRWVLDGSRLHLRTDPDRQLPAADPHGREQIISCGAVLHHARTGFAARGWHTDTHRLPDRADPGHLAVLEFRPWPDPPAGIAVRAAAMRRRHTDRLPLLPPVDWPALAPALRRLVTPHDLTFDALGDDARPQLARASAHAAAARRYDMLYQQELRWWAGHSEPAEGIPPHALPSAAEAARVGVARAFPAAPHSARRAEVADCAQLAVLASTADSPLIWLHTGEALSAVLLECTAAGLATCALTHITELPAARRTIAALLPRASVPQVVLRIGTAPGGEPPRPPTPRRPLADTFEIRRA